jgi:hypothetical protein
MALAGRHHARRARRAGVEPQVEVRQAGLGGDRQAAGAVLGDLEQVDRVDGQLLAQRGDQLAAELGGGARLRRGAGDAVQRGMGGVTARL